jgi:hypothetical protein
MFFDIWILCEATKNIEDRDIMTMSKYARKMDDVIDAMDLIVVVWANPFGANAEIGTVYSTVIGKIQPMWYFLVINLQVLQDLPGTFLNHLIFMILFRTNSLFYLDKSMRYQIHLLASIVFAHPE